MIVTETLTGVMMTGVGGHVLYKSFAVQWCHVSESQDPLCSELLAWLELFAVIKCAFAYVEILFTGSVT